jgi:hypothetical protein
VWPAALAFLILPAFIVIGGILIRDVLTLDLTIGSEVLAYRTTFRTRVFARSAVASCGVKEVAAAYGMRRVIRPYIRLHKQYSSTAAHLWLFQAGPRRQPKSKVARRDECTRPVYAKVVGRSSALGGRFWLVRTRVHKL